MSTFTSKNVPYSRFSVNSSVGFRQSRPESTGRRAMMNRASAASTTHSIRIFADADVLSPPSSSYLPITSAARHPESRIQNVSELQPNLDLDHRGEQNLPLPAKPNVTYFPTGQANRELFLEEPSSSTVDRRIRDESRRSNQDIMQLFPSPPRQPFYRPIRFASFRRMIPQPLQIDSSKRKVPTFNMDKRLPQPPYHVFNCQTKKLLTCLLSLVGVVAPLSGSIYFPALTAVGKEFHINYTGRLLTIAVYLATTGIAPLLVIPFSESLGRRPIMIILLLLFLGANIGLIFINNLTGFMLLRGLQGATSGPLYVLGLLVISDFSTDDERQHLKTKYGIVMLLGLLIGPVLGGLFTRFLWFQTTFWVLAIYGAIMLLLVTALLPETSRRLAGNGTIKLKAIQRPLVAIIRPSIHPAFIPAPPNTSGARQSTESFIESVRCLTDISILPSLLVSGLTFAILATVISTVALIFPPLFHLSPLLIGVAYLPSGAGSILGFLFMTYRLSSDHRIVAARHNIQVEKNPLPLESQPKTVFPIERARLRSAWWITLLFIGCVIYYGFSFVARGKIRLLILQFFIAAYATALLKINSTLIQDLHPRAPVGPAILFVGFVMAAVAVGTIELVLEKLGMGITFSVLGSSMGLASVVMVVQWVWGAKWRGKKQVDVKGKGVVI